MSRYLYTSADIKPMEMRIAASTVESRTVRPPVRILQSR